MSAYLSCLPHGFREFFQFFLNMSESMGANDPQDMANLDLRAIFSKIYAGDH